jgi:hypothetical protein
VTRVTLTRAQRDAMHHMILSGLGRREIARAIPVSSPKRVELRPRKRSAEVRP